MHGLHEVARSVGAARRQAHADAASAVEVGRKPSTTPWLAASHERDTSADRLGFASALPSATMPMPAWSANTARSASGEAATSRDDEEAHDLEGDPGADERALGEAPRERPDLARE